MTRQETERQEAISDLRELLKPGDTISTILRHVSRSGMSRSISVVIIRDGEVGDISWKVARALEQGFDNKRGGVKVAGCGTDMGFHLVHSLSYALFPDSFVCIGKACPANDHSNGDRDYTPHQHSKGAAGYALKQRWL